MMTNVLYHENRAFASKWCIVVPEKFLIILVEEANKYHFAGYLTERKVYDRLRCKFGSEG